MERSHRDEHGRLLAGSVPGWGMSWWWHEQGLDPADASELTPKQMMAQVLRYWNAVNDAWWPAVPRGERVGPHNPFDPVD
jgi:hypothetical protein